MIILRLTSTLAMRSQREFFTFPLGSSRLRFIPKVPHCHVQHIFNRHYKKEEGGGLGHSITADNEGGREVPKTVLF